MGLKNTIHKLFSKWISFKLFHFFPNDSVSQNALIILLTLGLCAAVGFIFTIIAARMYSIESLGIATLLLSYASIIIIITRFGTEQSMIRYYDENEKSSVFCSSVFPTTISAISLSLLLILISYFGVFGSDYLFTYSVVFIIGVTFLSVNQVCGGLFLASSKPTLYLIQNTIVSSRIIFLFLLVPLGVLGIFGSLVVAAGLSTFFMILLLFHLGIKFQLPDKKFISDSFHYSLGNYISDCLLTGPVFLIPIVVFFISGQKDTAIYSVSYAFASIAFIIPVSIGYALFMSGCNEKTTFSSIKTVIGAALVFLLGITLVFFFWGKEIVKLLGPDYSGAADLITIIMSSSIFALFFQVYSAEFKILQQMKKLLFVNCVFFVSLMMLSYLFITNFGLLGIGYAWIAAYGICVIPMIFYTLLNKIICYQG